MMNNNKGSVLVITLSFVLLFIALGIGSMHLGFVQSEVAEKEKGSTEAFWLADGAVEMAVDQLPTLIAAQNPIVYTPLGRGGYYVYSEPVVPGSTDNWKIDARGSVNVANVDGSVNNRLRGIIAKFGSYNIENAITTHGTVNGGCAPGGSATIAGNCAAHDPFTFETVFNGMTQADFEALAAVAGQEFTLNSPSDLWGIFGITVIHPVGNFGNPTFNTDNSAEYDGNPAFLIVDMSGYTGNPTPKLNIAGNADFCGIIWAVGELKVEGTGDVQGTIFVDGDPAGDTPFVGNADLAFNLPCIQGAIAQFGGTGPPSMYAWNEYTP